jgi:ribosomal protein S18 acetylase RimI-like enzyme
MNIEIRRAVPQDVPVLVKFNQLMAMETEGKELDTPTLTSGVNALFSDPFKGFYIVAEIEGEIAGQLMITYECSDWRNGNFWWIQSVYVAETFRKQHVFTTMYRYIENIARSNGQCCGIRLYVETNNLIAQEVYYKMGMHKTHYYLLEKDFRE